MADKLRSAAVRLMDHLAGDDRSFFVGVSGDEAGPLLYVYTSRAPSRQRISPEEWEGFRVVEHRVGKVRPVAGPSRHPSRSPGDRRTKGPKQ